MAQHLPGNQEDREAYLREHRAARFIEMVKDVRDKPVDYVLMTVGAFAGEPNVLYVALDYAYHAGVAVTMSPGPLR